LASHLEVEEHIEVEEQQKLVAEKGRPSPMKRRGKTTPTIIGPLSGVS
jgi:hypothetical protein